MKRIVCALFLIFISGLPFVKGAEGLLKREIRFSQVPAT